VLPILLSTLSLKNRSQARLSSTASHLQACNQRGPNSHHAPTRERRPEQNRDNKIQRLDELKGLGQDDATLRANCPRQW